MMKRRMLAALLLAFCLLGAPGLVGAESLWSDSGALYDDQKARRIGDVLTIIINESSSAARTGSAWAGETMAPAAKPTAAARMKARRVRAGAEMRGVMAFPW